MNKALSCLFSMWSGYCSPFTFSFFVELSFGSSSSQAGWWKGHPHYRFQHSLRCLHIHQSCHNSSTLSTTIRTYCHSLLFLSSSHFSMSISTMSHHGVAESLSNAVRVSGSPVVDMLVATLVSGLLLQHLPRLLQALSKGLTRLFHRLFTAWVSRDADFKHAVVLTATSISGADHEEQRNNIQAPVHSPVVASPDNLPVIMGCLHYFQRHRIHFDVAGAVQGHIQPATLQPTSRDKYLNSTLSFIPEAPIVHKGLRFTFTTGTVAGSDNNQNDNSSQHDDDDGNEGGSRRQRPSGPVATMTIRVEGDDLSFIQSFLVERMREEVDLAYPAPEKEVEHTFLFELHHANGRAQQQQQNLQFVRSPFSTTKTFRTVFFQQKEALLTAMKHFEGKTGPWAPERERPHKLVILLEGPPGTGTSHGSHTNHIVPPRHVPFVQPTHTVSLMCSSSRRVVVVGVAVVVQASRRRSRPSPTSLSAILCACPLTTSRMITCSRDYSGTRRSTSCRLVAGATK